MCQNKPLFISIDIVALVIFTVKQTQSRLASYRSAHTLRDGTIDPTAIEYIVSIYLKYNF
jgi:cobalamin biosynthesis protein CbiG